MDLDLMDIKEFNTFILKRGCVKCGHQWFPRLQNPQRCPRCQTWLDKPVEDASAKVKNKNEKQE